MRKFTQLLKTQELSSFCIPDPQYAPIESEPFTWFSKNGAFGKPGNLRDFRGLKGPWIIRSGPMKNHDDLPYPQIMQKRQEFSIRQGVVGSKTEPILSPVSTFPGNGVRHGPGFGELSTLENGGHVGSFRSGFRR